MTHVDIARKPASNRCPGKFCFHWRTAGTMAAEGLSESLSTALAKARVVEQTGCGYTLGRCARLDGLSGGGDAYEPHEPCLAHHGLPWFFFIPRPENLLLDVREQYIRESEGLWGPKHWLD